MTLTILFSDVYSYFFCKTKRSPHLDAEDPFPYIFNGKDADERQETFLKNDPASQLSSNQLVVIETIISSYIIPTKGQSSGRSGYSMSLREIYVVDSAFSGHTELSPVDCKR